ncbi:MAG: GGDEF domain-containing protein, partial [Candidatus Desulfofervidaceae bacterium]|nr:GGDEF domain-containing protein [Candidatus Desulfofervidaceae bacterium]
INNFIVYEVNNSENRFEVMVNECKDVKNKIFPDLLLDCNLCPVKRNSEAVSSLQYPNVCPYAYIDDQYLFHYCLPIMMGGHVGAVLKIVAKREQSKQILAQVPFLKKYLEEIAPILEAKRSLILAKQQALRDPLTGLYNRRFMEEYINKWEPLLKRQEGKCTLLMLDLDHFKHVNDKYGHQTGDLVLKKMAKLFMENLRASDVIFRYGGEEFLIILPDTSKKDGVFVGEQLRQAVEIASFESLDGETVKITVSVGVAAYPEDGRSLWDVIKMADTALYMAKTGGRNKVVPYQKDMKVNIEEQE